MYIEQVKGPLGGVPPTGAPPAPPLPPLPAMLESPALPPAVVPAVLLGVPAVLLGVPAPLPPLVVPALPPPVWALAPPLPAVLIGFGVSVGSVELVQATTEVRADANAHPKSSERLMGLVVSCLGLIRRQRSATPWCMGLFRLPRLGSEIGVFSLGYLAFLGAGCTSSDPPGSGSGGGAGGAPSGGTGAGVPASVAGSNTSGSGTTAGGSGASGGAGGSAQAGMGPAGASGNGGGGSGGAPVIGDRSPEGTCARWNADRANLDEGTWSGSVATCEPGDISADGRENALRMFNLVRWLADLPPVQTEEQRNLQAQACALMMTANEKLSHDPPMSWKCYSKLGTDGAKTSNISSGPGVSSVLSYMVDNGNDTTHGHRRIILGNGLGPIGLGSAGEDGSSCMQNIGGEGDAGKEWMAWPPPGPFPMDAYSIGYADMDETGWSIQSEDIDLSDASVTITAGGEPRPVQVYQLEGNYGGAGAIRIVPMGWTAQAGTTYSVSVSGTSTPIAYEVQMIECE